MPTKTEVELAKMKSDIEYIKKAMDANTEQHKEIINSFERYTSELKEVINLKADKDDFDKLQSDYNSFKQKLITTSISALIALAGFIIKFIIEKVLHN